MDRRAFTRALATLATASALPALAADPALPKGPIRVVVGFPPGGGTDVIARIVANKLGALWGVPVVVDNKAGAAGLIAAAEVAKAAPDGNTLMLGHINALGIAPGLHARLNFSAEKDFTAIALVGKTPQVLIASRAQPVKTVQALIELARKSPKQITFGSAGSGSAQHLALALFEQRSGISVLHVPYKGSAPLATDLLGGHVQFAFEGMTTATTFIKDGKLMAIAQTGNKRVKSYSDVPTVAESGFPGFDASIWFGVVGPAGLPAAMVARINADVNKVLAMPDVAAKLEEFGAEDGGGSPERFAEFMRAEQAKWAKLIKERKITAEA
ncbi:Bug family tripartite tricarboxylate transporter substrate binding protein [Cupriavidus necator]|uniref:Bug family tripartite tricarboxylate transporter substrate binding protein n=1 Tax=Cupriavidus necator TaxID=106590 RepID=UPI0005B48B4C|nr:tripartite tricarboxylate transporter substrate binding protein [Cupriavidus necator]